MRLYNFISTVKHFALACRAHLQLLPVLALGCPAVNSPFFARPVIKFTAPLSISHTLKLQATRISMVLSLWAPLITISIIIYDFNFVQLLLAFLLIATSQLPVLLPTPAHTHTHTCTLQQTHNCTSFGNGHRMPSVGFGLVLCIISSLALPDCLSACARHNANICL